MKLLCTLLLSVIFTGTYTAVAQTSPTPHTVLDIRNDSTYNAAYQKLKQLYITRIHSPSYIKYREAITSYKKKWRHLYKENVVNLYNDSGALKWLENNWQKTEFKSYEEAVAEWENILNLVKDDNNEHQEFQNQMISIILKYGPEVYADLEFEMRREYPDKM